MFANIMAIHAAGMSINLISLIGLIIVAGMIVDDVVVVVENIFRRCENGDELKVAIVEGAHEMVLPVFSSVATTIAAFSAFLLMTGIFGKFIYEIPVMVIGALLFSLVEGFLIAPVHFETIVGPRIKSYISKASAQKSKYKRFLDNYRLFIGTTIRFRYVTLIVLFGVVFGGTIYVAKERMGFVLFPP